MQSLHFLHYKSLLVFTNCLALNFTIISSHCLSTLLLICNMQTENSHLFISSKFSFHTKNVLGYLLSCPSGHSATSYNLKKYCKSIIEIKDLSPDKEKVLILPGTHFVCNWNFRKTTSKNFCKIKRIVVRIILYRLRMCWIFNFFYNI